MIPMNPQRYRITIPVNYYSESLEGYPQINNLKPYELSK
jgi:hypothetical protein